MKTFKEFLVEDKRTASEIAEVIYRFTSGLTYGGERVECHASVSKVKKEGQDLQAGRFKFHSMLSYIEWDESKWGDFEKVVESDKSWRNIKIKEFQSLVSDISDGSVNGHSFIKVFNFYIDPYFNSCGLTFEEIQKSCKWFIKMYKRVGII
tara:strand:- start:110 stop:562 length:453 start_codon:yes stop_codon:yes gene_type:complete